MIQQILAPGLFVLLWSTGFIGAKLGLPYAEPATFLAVRLSIVALALAIFVILFRVRLPATGMQTLHIAMAGFLAHGVYLGGVFGAIYYGVDAGVSALIVGIQPLLTAALVGPLLGESVSRRQWLGFLIGLCGVALVVSRKFSLDGQDLLGFGFCIVGLAGITIGTVYQKRFCTSMDLRSGSMIQFAVAALLMWVFAIALETREIEWHLEFIFAMIWLCVVLSLGAISLLWWLVRNDAAAKVASLFYLVPPIVALEAWFLFAERLGPLSIVGMVLCAVGVWLVMKPVKKT